MIAEQMQNAFKGPAIRLPVKLYFSFRPTSLTVKAKGGIEKLKVGTWNLLAPPYHRRTIMENKRSRRGSKIMEDWENWKERVQQQIDLIKALNLDIVFLQEFWCDKEHTKFWSEYCESNDLSMFVAQRTGNKCDGCCTIVNEKIVKLSKKIEDVVKVYSFNDWGNRICLLLNGYVDGNEIKLFNTHLTFAHENEYDPIQRYHQARKLAEVLHGESSNGSGVLILGGDLNGNLQDSALQNFIALASMDGEERFNLHDDGGDWISHRSHLLEFSATDYFVTSNQLKVSHWEMCGKLDGYDMKSIEHKIKLQTDQELSDHLLLAATIELPSKL